MIGYAEPLFEVEGAEGPDSLVYVIGIPGSHVVKIGTSVQVEKRLKGIQTSSPERLAILWRVAGDRRLEDQLHVEFRPYRRSGEWFDFGELDPIPLIAAAVQRLTGVPIEDQNLVEPPEAPEPDRRFPPIEDPDYHNPLYQPDENGCRSLTPAELQSTGMAADAVAVYCTYTRCRGTH